jgi:hypothetical protein
MWRLRSPPLQGGVVLSYNLCGSAWMHALLLILTYILYVKVPDLQGADCYDVQINKNYVFINIQDLISISDRLFVLCILGGI